MQARDRRDEFRVSKTKRTRAYKDLNLFNNTYCTRLVFARIETNTKRTRFARPYRAAKLSGGRPVTLFRIRFVRLGYPFDGDNRETMIKSQN